MPRFEKSGSFGVSGRLKAFFALRLGATRGDVPSYSEAPAKVSSREDVAGIRRRLAALEREESRLKGELAGIEDAPAFFVVGNGRSGTTWLMRMLDSHPEVLCRGEGWFFKRGYRQDHYKDIHPRLPVCSLYNALAESEAMRLWIERSVWTAGGDPEEHLDDLTGAAVRYFMERRLARAGKRVVGDKSASPGAEVMDEIAGILPGSKVVHIVRDGRDVAVSINHFLWNRAKGEEVGIYDLSPEELQKREAYRNDPSAAEGLFTKERLTEIARGWNEQVGETMERGPKVLGADYFEMRYESLLESPERELRRLLDFLGADSSEEAVKECVEATSFERKSGRKRGEESSSSVNFRKGVAGDWRNVFTEEDKEVFKEEAGDLLIKLGYEEDGSW